MSRKPGSSDPGSTGSALPVLMRQGSNAGNAMNKVYAELAMRLTAMENCKASDNSDWYHRHEAVLNAVLATAPHGAGVDVDTTIDYAKSRTDRLVLSTSFHHMLEDYYAGWSDHDLVITPSLQFGFNLRITGTNRNDIKEYLREIFGWWLEQAVEISYPDNDPDATPRTIIESEEEAARLRYERAITGTDPDATDKLIDGLKKSQ